MCPCRSCNGRPGRERWSRSSEKAPREGTKTFSCSVSNSWASSARCVGVRRRRRFQINAKRQNRGRKLLVLTGGVRGGWRLRLRGSSGRGRLGKLQGDIGGLGLG